MGLFKKQTLALSAVPIFMLVVLQTACSPVSPSVSKFAKGTDISNTDEIAESVVTDNDSIEPNLLQQVASDALDREALFITESQLEKQKRSKEAKVKSKYSEVPEKSLIEFRRDWELDVAVDDLGLATGTIESQEMKTYIVVDNVDSKTLEHLVEYFDVKTILNKSTNDDAHARIVIKLIATADQDDPVKAVDAERTLAENLRRIVFVLKKN